MSTVSGSAEEGYAEGSVFIGSTVATEEGGVETGDAKIGACREQNRTAAWRTPEGLFHSKIFSLEK